MCLAAVYAEARDDKRELVLDKVQLIEVDGEKLTLTNLFGKTLEITGSVQRIDLANSSVLIRMT